MKEFFSIKLFNSEEYIFSKKNKILIYFKKSAYIV